MAHRKPWPKPITEAMKASTKAGWTWTRKGTGHYEVRNPQGEFVVMISSTFYDGPLTHKFLARLRKAGCPGA